MDDERSRFVKQWFDRSTESVDEFERFVFLWLAFVVEIKVWAANNGLNSGEEGDRHDGFYVNKFFSDSNNRQASIDLFQQHANPELLKRKSSEGDYIVKSSDADKDDLQHMYKHHTQGAFLNSGMYCRAIGKLLKAVRNNLFHGGKLYDSKEDRVLLEHCTPILEAFVIELAHKHLYIRLEDKHAT